LKPASIPWLRAEVERDKARLQDIDEFDVIWGRYVAALRHMVAQMSGRDDTQMPSDVYGLLPAAEELRVEVIALGPVKFDSDYFWRVEFTRLTQANLRTQPEKLFVQLLEGVPDEVWDPGEPRSVVTQNALDALVGEAQGLINRKREEIKKDIRQKQFLLNEKVADEQGKKASSGEVTLLALLRKWAGKIRKGLSDIAGGAVKEQIKKGIGVVFVVVLVALVYLFAPTFARKVRQRWRRFKGDTVQTEDSTPTRADTVTRPGTTTRTPR
jgi:hypothetical protein